MIARSKFFDGYKREFGTYKDSIEFLLNKLDESFINDARWMSYILATIQHETANTYLPVTEYGSKAYLRGKKYYPYIGRGFVQLTHDYNYKKFGKELGIDLYNNPNLANDPEIAWKVLELGMTSRKVNFTGKVLGDYFNEKTDWVNARRIINGRDRAEHIANIGKKFYKIIEFE